MVTMVHRTRVEFRPKPNALDKVVREHIVGVSFDSDEWNAVMSQFTTLYPDMVVEIQLSSVHLIQVSRES